MKAKFNKLDRSKLSKEVNSILDKIKKATDNFKKEDKKAEALFDRLYDKIKEGKPEAIKSTKKPSKSKKKKTSGGNRGVFTKLAKSIRDAKPSLTWKQAMAEASKKLKADKEKANKKFSSSIQTLIDSNKKYFGSAKASSLEKDAKQPAKPIGKRRSKNGKTYYEYRTNRTDVKQPPKSFPMLEKGGIVWKKNIGDDGWSATMENESAYDNVGGYISESGNWKIFRDGRFYKRDDGYENYKRDGSWIVEGNDDFKGMFATLSEAKKYVKGWIATNPKDYAKGGNVEFRKLAKSKNFDIITDEGRFEIEMGAFDMPKNIIVDGTRKDINTSPIAKKYRAEIQDYLDANYEKGGNVDYKGTLSDDVIEDIVKDKGFNVQIRQNSIDGFQIIGQKKELNEVKSFLEKEYNVKTKFLPKRGIGLHTLKVPTQTLMFEKGGNIDLFDSYETLPKKVRDTIDFYMEKYQDGDYTYEDSKNFLEEMQKQGYTFEYGLDNEPYDLRKMEKGGKIGFEGLAKKVAKNYEGKKVKPKFESEYGKTYDKEEAMQVGRAVAGKVLKQQNMKKMEDGGIVRDEGVAYQGGMSYGTTENIAPQFEHGGNVNRGSFNVTITMKDGRGADILPIDVSKEDAKEIADMINNMKPMSAKAEVSLPFAKGGKITQRYYTYDIVGDKVHIYQQNKEDENSFDSIEQIITQLTNEGFKEKDFVVLKKDGRFAKGGKTQGKDDVYFRSEATLRSIIDGVEKEGKRPSTAYYNAKAEYDSPFYKKLRGQSGKKMKRGGKTQGYNARLDESLGNRKGKESTKQQSKKDRRDESKGMEKGSGRRAYSSVSTMDVGDRMMAKGGNVPKRFLDEKGERKNDPETIEKLTEYVMSLPQTKSKHFNKATKKYSPKRQKLHRQIINEFKGDLVCIESDEPIAILMGGSPASGKSTFLRKYAPYLLKEELLRIDADEVRAMLPEYKGWNASATHNETQDIVKTLLSDRTIGVPCKYDVIFDGTMTSPKKYLDLIRLLKKLGYKVFVVFIDKVPKDVIMKRAMDRYKKSGRFVPPFVIEEFFESGKDSLAKVKAKVDGYMIVDGSDSNYRVAEQKGLKLPKTRKYSRLGVPLKKRVTRKKK